MKDNAILGEFYDNGFNVDQTQLLQSSSKTYAGVIAWKLIDEGKLDPAATVESHLADFKGSAIGKAKIQHVLDMEPGFCLRPTIMRREAKHLSSRPSRV